MTDIIKDLEQGICRTPLEPVQTFLDDPLRVLRTIRFANRFEFSVEESIVFAAKLPQVKEALYAKVSYERLGVELDKMFEGNLPESSMAMIYDFDIASILYKLPPECAELQDEKLVKTLIAKSVDICHVLGHLFKEFK